MKIFFPLSSCRTWRVLDLPLQPVVLTLYKVDSTQIGCQCLEQAAVVYFCPKQASSCPVWVEHLMGHCLPLHIKNQSHFAANWKDDQICLNGWTFAIYISGLSFDYTEQQETLEYITDISRGLKVSPLAVLEIKMVGWGSVKKRLCNSQASQTLSMCKPLQKCQTAPSLLGNCLLYMHMLLILWPASGDNVALESYKYCYG